jgi:hypothetical protein
MTETWNLWVNGHWRKNKNAIKVTIETKTWQNFVHINNCQNSNCFDGNCQTSNKYRKKCRILDLYEIINIQIRTLNICAKNIFYNCLVLHNNIQLRVSFYLTDMVWYFSPLTKALFGDPLFGYGLYDKRY